MAIGADQTASEGITPASWRRHLAAVVTRPELDRPVVPGIVAAVVGTVFVLARLTVAAHGKIAAFVIAGTRYANPAKVPAGLPVRPGGGYDGQFYYRMALDPLDLARTAFGIRLDTIGRLGRIGYPALSWLLAFGHASFVPSSLVVVNVLAFAFLGVAGGALARGSGHPALVGLIFPAYWGYLWTMSRDLTGLVTAALLVGGVVALRRGSMLWATVLLTGAVLSKETAVVFVAVYGLSRLQSMVRRHDRVRPDRADAAWIVPGVAYVTWQSIAVGVSGKFPLVSSSGHNLTLPFTGFAPALGHYVSLLPSTASLLWCGELAVLVIVTVATAVTVDLRRVPRYELWAWCAFILELVVAARGIWFGDVGFRSFDDLYLFGWILMLPPFAPAGTPAVGSALSGAPAGSPGLPRGPVAEPEPVSGGGLDWRRPVAAIVACTWLVVAVELVKFL